MYSWFSRQWHVVDSSVQTIAELNECLREIEDISQSYNPRSRTKIQTDMDRNENPRYIDVVVISHEFTDHCNKNTLLELDPETPIFATKLAANLIRSWKYFTSVQDTPTSSEKSPDWRETSLNPLPAWLGISRITNETDALYYHSAILITFDLTSGSGGPSGVFPPAEAITYTPHGIHAHDLSFLPSAVPPIKTLALLHGLHDIRISIKHLNLGAHNGLQAQRICRAKYWISTHDEIKRASGLITPFLHRKILTLQEAFDEAEKIDGGLPPDSDLAIVKEVIFADLSSGESLLLE